MKGIIAVVLLVLSGSAFGQCISSVPSVPNWPNQITFQPANPAPGQPVTATLGPPTSYWPPSPNATVLTGNVITVSEELAIFGGVPPPPSPMIVQLGSYPAGVYTVRIRLTGDTQITCNPLDATLVVGGVGGVGSVPASSTVALLALLLGVIGFAAYRLSTRS